MSKQHLVAVIGAGPAGIYGTRKLVEAGHHVVLLNRDIKPGGLAEYGIFLDKEKMKTGLRKQFKKILADPKVFYLGHVSVGHGQALTLADLEQIGLSAIVVTAGAQGTKKLGIPGEESVGVYHAKDVVYHYNSLPPFSQKSFEIGRRVAIIGMGNVMVDIANWLLNHKKIDQVVVVARRGPLEKAYDDGEFEVIEQYLDNREMKQEIERIRPQLTAVGQNIDEIMEKFVKDGVPAEGRRLQFRYLSSPTKVIANDHGGVAALEVEENELILQDGRTVAKGTGKHAQIEVDCVIYAIGDQVDASLGLPFSRGVFVTNPGKVLANPDPAAYQPYDPEAARVLEGIYVAGWSRNASVGLVGVAKQDAERGMKVVNEYLSAKEGFAPGEMEAKIEAILDNLKKKRVSVVTKEDIEILESVEHEEARNRNTWDFKFIGDDEMLQVIRERKARAN
ncbi:MAG TPA: FAD-dependent oxidoreductase [Candidatus Binatia bacterium]|nr:FAD-dependent oxidoreductase [Candidatus Binatia bacterium]